MLAWLIRWLLMAVAVWITAKVVPGIKIRSFGVAIATAAVYGNPKCLPVDENAALAPVSPYGMSKLMTETMLRDTAAATDLRYIALRYFNVAGADPQGRSGQSTPEATHLIKAACEVICGKRAGISIFGDDYDTPDGTGVRDYIHVTDLADAHVAALDYLMAGGASDVMNCGYGRGYSVRQVLDTVRAVCGHDFLIETAPRRPGDQGGLAGPAKGRAIPDYRYHGRGGFHGGDPALRIQCRGAPAGHAGPVADLARPDRKFRRRVLVS